MILRFALLLALALPTAAVAEPLTIGVGESWVFTVRNGQPVGARQVPATATPGKGQVMATVRAFLGTALTVTNNSPVSYTFDAQLVSRGKAIAARACTLPGGARPIFERWEQSADAVRIGNFKTAGNDGRC